MIVFDQNYATDNSCGEMKKRFCKYEGARHGGTSELL